MGEMGDDIGVCSRASDQTGDSEYVSDVDDAAVIGKSMKDLDEIGFAPIVANTMFRNPKEGNDCENITSMDCGMSSLVIDISQFPPLPAPRYKLRRQETTVGIFLVVMLSLLCIGTTHGISLVAVGGLKRHSTTWWAFFVLIYVETGMALILLAALLFSDPGVVRRSKENSFPIPLQCELWITAHLDGKAHEVQAVKERYISSSDPDTIGDSYCVRCLVWRRLRHAKCYFHCNICQRCVMDYDHHCSVFGRCIGGTIWRGNYRFFVGLIAVGIMGSVTSVSCLLCSVSLRYRPEIAVPITLFLIWLTGGILMGRQCIGVCNKLRNVTMGCITSIGKFLTIY